MQRTLSKSKVKQFELQRELVSLLYKICKIHGDLEPQNIQKHNKRHLQEAQRTMTMLSQCMSIKEVEVLHENHDDQFIATIDKLEEFSLYLDSLQSKFNRNEQRKNETTYTINEVQLRKEQLQNVKTIHNFDANSDDEITQYFITSIKGMNAVIQQNNEPIDALYRLVSLQFRQQYVEATISYNQKQYKSYYIRKSYRGQRIFESICKEVVSKNETILTTKSCNIETVLDKFEVNYVVAKTFFDFESPAYELISTYYGDERTKRNNVPKLYHILEGLSILSRTSLLSNSVDKDTLDAYCLHPLTQAQDYYARDLLDNYNKSNERTNVVLLASQYAVVANSYLLHHHMSDSKLQKLQKDLQQMLVGQHKIIQMLVADKIQNRKDFHAYYTASSYKNYVELTSYFEHWLQQLDVNKAMIQTLNTAIAAPTAEIRIINKQRA